MHSIQAIAKKTAPINPSIPTTKHFIALNKKSEKQYYNEFGRWMDIMFCATGIVLMKDFQPKQAGITKLGNMIPKIIAECGAEKEISICRLLEDETGITLSNGDKTWRECAFMNPDIPINNWTAQKLISYRQESTKWIYLYCLAAVEIACHRLWKWSAEGNLSKLVPKIMEVVDKYKNNQADISAEFQRVTGLNENKIKIV